MTPILHVQSVSKRFPGVQALDSVDLKVFPGEVLAIVGENGAGKSSLMKILSGIDQPSSGSILIDGHPVRIDSVPKAHFLGISLIHQELSLSDNLSVEANIFLGREPLRWGLIAQKDIHHRSQQLLERVGLNVDPRTLVRDLTIGQQQLVEIARALSVKARVIIMDEPTSSLSQGESETLFHVVGELRASGVSVIYISHRLAEVQRLADRVYVFRDGRNVGEVSRGHFSHESLVQMMIGRELSRFYSRTPHAPGKVALAVDGLMTQAWPQHSLSFSLRQGEIVGISGLVGAGRSEVLRAIFGIEPPLHGAIYVQGQKCRIATPRDAIDAGIALVPEDRKTEGLLLESTVAANLTLAGLGRFCRMRLFVNHAKSSSDTRQMIDQLRIKTPSPRQSTQFLSGGNQQKIVLGKWLTMQPRVLMMDEPTRGIDVGAKQEIYQLMESLASQGVAILFVSSELEEIIGISDRVLVMCEGAITGELARAELGEAAIMRLATHSSMVSLTSEVAHEH
jgi:ribose transport system ATP-binding protein